MGHPSEARHRVWRARPARFFFFFPPTAGPRRRLAPATGEIGRPVPIDVSRCGRTMSVSCRRYTILASQGGDAVYHELTVWSRGIIMDKEARDVSS